MVHVLMREFTDSFKSVRSILIILFLTFIAYLSASFLEDNPGLLDAFMSAQEDGASIYTGAVSIIILILGFLFVFAISHDVINKEIETRTIRLLVNKIPRWQIVIGKALGILFFWMITILISYIILTMISGELYLAHYFKTILFLLYVISFVLFISSIIPKSKLTMFLGILLGISLPVLGLISVSSEKWYFLPFKYLLPYYYMEDESIKLLIPLIFSIIFLIISVVIMKRRDL
ncbi:ABC-2 type transport system permease protein [Gracilibacillus ureilyticus]|uniref:ABC-2 type transport system permease protein n=1 Tax=Gracilibacillus ureilyticus TaxID=531814 RepID=A0A1H9MK27_9BACI|nr:ABC transporter permease [Gracilibacillus ureilyticus]SER24036.1 ABC-2 type transport system permease protein [Gracilibacillus ureilyticus]